MAESKLRRLGTILGGRRRQSMHPGMASQKTGSSPFGRLGSKEGRGVSPKGSYGNLKDSTRLGALSEAPDLPQTPENEEGPSGSKSLHEGTNGVSASENLMDSPVPTSAAGGVNGTQAESQSAAAIGGSSLVPTSTQLSSSSQRDQPQQQQQAPAPPTKDAEGYSIPAPVHDPISAAQREASGIGSEEADQLFRLNIQNKPIEEEDPQAKQAALSSVANSLKAGPAVRRSGTTRGRRDVRNTIYVPSPNVVPAGTAGPIDTFPMPPSTPSGPAPAGMTGMAAPPPNLSPRPTAVAALASETSGAATSDSQSVRSGTSLGSLAHAKHPDMSGPGLNSSIIETVSVHYEGGEVKTASIAGEIAFVNNPTDDDNKSKFSFSYATHCFCVTFFLSFVCFRVASLGSESRLTKPAHETIRINNFASLDRIGPNRIFVQNTTAEQPDQFRLDVSHLNKMTTAFSYRVFSPGDEGAAALGRHAPLELTPAWKPQGDKLGLLIQYRLNPSGVFPSPTTLHNVVLVASYEGRASGAQTKPSGTHLKDRHLVYWRLGDVTLTHETHKIVCRFLGSGDGSPDSPHPTPGHVEARWEYAVPAPSSSADAVAGSPISISRLVEGKGKEPDVAPDDDPFADTDPAPAPADHAWSDVPLTKKLVSGKYEGK